MDLYKPAILLCLLFAIRTVHSILLNKHDILSNTLHKELPTYRLLPLAPGRLDVRAGNPLLRKLPGIKDSLLSHLIPRCNVGFQSPLWLSKTTHETNKLSPEEETIHRDDQTLMKWTRGHDGSIIDTPQYDVVHGIYEKNEASVDDTHRNILNEIHRKMHETTPKENRNDYPHAEVTYENNIVLSDNSTELEKGNLRSTEIDEKGENIILLTGRSESKPKSESSESNPKNNHIETPGLEEVSPDSEEIKVEITEHSKHSTTSDSSPESVKVSDDTVDERTDETGKSSVEGSEDYQEAITVTNRFHENVSPPTAPVDEIQRIAPKNRDDLSDKELFELFLKRTEQKLISRNQHQANPAAFRMNPPTSATSRDAFQPNYVAPLDDPYGFYPNHVGRVESYPPTIHPLGSYRFPDSDPYNPQEYNSGYRKYGDGPPATPYNLIYPNLDQNQALASYLANARQGLFGYGQEVPSYESMARMYRYMNELGGGFTATQT